MSYHHSNSDSIFSFITGMIVQIVGMITFETFWIPLCLAFAGGFLGLIGKKLAEIAVAKVQRWIMPKGRRRRV
jgi:hypothetical protein